MKLLSTLDNKCRILSIKSLYVQLRKSCSGVCPNSNDNLLGLLGKDVERACVNITINEDDFSLCFLDKRNQQFESIVDLASKNTFCLGAS